MFADVEPTNTIPLPSQKANKKKGTTRLTVDLPNPGELTASGGPIKTASAGAAAVGPLTLLLRPTKSAKKRLRNAGKAKGTVTLSYTPSFGLTATRTVKVKLKKNS